MDYPGIRSFALEEVNKFFPDQEIARLAELGLTLDLPMLVVLCRFKARTERQFAAAALLKACASRERGVKNALSRGDHLLAELVSSLTEPAVEAALDLLLAKTKEEGEPKPLGEQLLLVARIMTPEEEVAGLEQPGDDKSADLEALDAAASLEIRPLFDDKDWEEFIRYERPDSLLAITVHFRANNIPEVERARIRAADQLLRRVRIAKGELSPPGDSEVDDVRTATLALAEQMEYGKAVSLLQLLR
jgi:hypothetical protein